MTKGELLGKICYADAINECCSGDGDTSCDKCELEMSILLDKYAEQIRADAIAEISREMRVPYGNDYEKQTRTDAESKAYTRVLDILEQLDEQMCEKVKDMLYEQDYQDFAKEQKNDNKSGK